MSASCGMLRFSDGKCRLRILPSISNKKEINVATAQGSLSLYNSPQLTAGSFILHNPARMLNFLGKKN